MRRSAPLALALIAALAPARPAAAATTIDVRVSVKVILSNFNGQRPAIYDLGFPFYVPIQDQNIYAMTDFANDSLLSEYWRGYRFVIDEIQDVGGICSPCTASNPSFWYGTVFDSASMKNMEIAAMANPVAYRWRADAVNLYVNWGHGNGAISSFPPPYGGSNDLVIAGSRVWYPGFRAGFPGVIVHHELGHFFNLPHTHRFDCCNPGACIADGDSIPDTLPDGPCFTLDSLSIARYGQHFTSVSPSRQDSLVSVWNNNMAYLHYDQRDAAGEGYGQYFQTLLTELQLDRWTDVANDKRTGVRNARTRFVSPIPCASCPVNGSSQYPYRSLATAVSAAGTGDIILLRPGDYPSSPPFNQPMTLRAAHAGAARITNP